MPSLDRKHTRICRSFAEAEDRGYMPGTPEERLSEVWELTQEAWSFLQGAHAEQRLQRDVVVVRRAGGRAQDLADVEKLESAPKRD